METGSENMAGESEKIILMQVQQRDFVEMINISTICRLCASQSDKLIGIYSEDGITNDLPNRINTYLPIKVSETDQLPLECCWQCASTVVAWHNLIVTCVEADQKLRGCQFISEKELQTELQYQAPEISLITEEQEGENCPASVQTSLNSFCQSGTHNDVSSESNENDRNVEISERNVELGLTPFINLSSYNSVTEPTNTLQKTHVDQGDPETCNNTKDSMKDTKADESSEEMTFYNFECEYCHKIFVTESEIMIHLNKSHEDEMEFDLEDEEEEDHVKLKEESLDIKDEEIDIIKAKKKEKRRKILKICHLDQEVLDAAKFVIDNKEYYKCEDCNKTLHSPYTFKSHIRIHTGERPFTCHLCGKSFRVSQGLMRHIRETHERIKIYPCDLCGRMFTTKRNVDEHRNIHTDDRPYTCITCGKSFRQKASLFVHKRTHTDHFPFKCQYCGHGFRTVQSLNVHVSRHTGEKPYPCEHCGRRFRIKYELKRHMLIHSDDKPYSCNVCNVSFRQKRYLKNHNRANHQESAART